MNLERQIARQKSLDAQLNIDKSLDLIREHLKRIDSNTIQDIFNEIRSKSGLTQFPIGQFKIAVTWNPESRKGGWQYRDTITINAASPTFATPDKIQNKLLSICIHEYVHAYAGDGGGENNTGFKDGSANELLNEGFTELIADFVYEEYIRRTGDKLGQKTNKRTFISYVIQRREVSEILDSMSKEAGLPFEVVFNAYVSAYFNRDTESFLDSVATIRKDA
jgi:hypothetical protein